MVRALFGSFAAVQTFFWLARRDRFGILFWWTGETWLYVLLMWLKDLVLAAAVGVLAARLLKLVTDASEREKREPSSPLRPFAEAAWVLPILTLGVVLRWTFRAWNPPGLWVDVVYAARPLFGGTSVSPWGASPFGDNAASHEVVSNLYVAFIRGVFGLFGSGETGFFAISALPGSLALLAFWWLGREAFGARTAVAATILAALLAWPLLLSRWTSTAALLLALTLIAAAALLRAMRMGRVAPAVLSGACVGLSLHTHASAGAVAAGFAIFALFAARNVRARRLVRAGAAAAAVAFAPLAWAFVSGPARLGGHLRDVHLATPVKAADLPRVTGAFRVPVMLASNALEYSGLLLWTRDPNLRHAARRGVATPLVGALALLGIGLAASRRRPADVLLLLLAAGSLSAGLLSNPGGSPNTLRASALVVPAVVLAATVFETGIARPVRAGFASRNVFLAGLAAALFVVETLPALLEFPARAGAAQFCAMETETGRLLARLADAPVVLESGTVLYPVVVEAVAHGADRSLPLDHYERKTPAEVLAAPPGRPFWLLASPRGLADLSAGGLTCGRGIPPAGDGSRVVLARVRGRVASGFASALSEQVVEGRAGAVRRVGRL